MRIGDYSITAWVVGRHGQVRILNDFIGARSRGRDVLGEASAGVSGGCDFRVRMVVGEYHVSTSWLTYVHRMVENERRTVGGGMKR